MFTRFTSVQQLEILINSSGTAIITVKPSGVMVMGCIVCAIVCATVCRRHNSHICANHSIF